jgi:hypothetical protein
MPMPESLTEIARVAVLSAVLHFGGNDHLSAIGEFNRTIDEVDMDLSEPQWIVNEVWRNIRLGGN